MSPVEKYSKLFPSLLSWRLRSWHLHLPYQTRGALGRRCQINTHASMDFQRSTLGTFGVNRVLRSSGLPCTTLGQVDQALRDTTAFWQEAPPDYSPEWDLVLDDCRPRSSCQSRVPTRDDLLHHLLQPGARPRALWELPSTQPPSAEPR